MSQSPPNYMDGVPVKISERFKPPPKITLPQGVINRLAQIEHGGALRAAIGYDFGLEETVLKRITEWRSAKEKERYERDERVRLKEQERARLVDEEQKRKLNQISYPNTDDLSSASEGEDEPSEENDESSPSGSSEEQVLKNKTPVVSSGTEQYSHMNKFDTILMPTVLPEVAAAMIGATDKAADSGTPLSFSIPKNTNTNVWNNNNNNIVCNMINYSDFENDTSSPFDNMELKTINDLDILAQVYNLNICNSDSGRSPEDFNGGNAKPLDKKPNKEASPEQNTTVATAQHQPDYQQQSQYPQAVYPQNTPQQAQTSDYYKSFNSYQYNYGQYAASSTAGYTSADSRFLSQYNSTAGTSYQPSVQSQYQPFSQGLASSTYNYYPYTSSSDSSASPAQSTYANAYFYSNAYGHQSQLMPGGYNYAAQGSATVSETPSSAGFGGGVAATDDHPPVSDPGEVSSMRSKSKSVPDIVRKLDEEVKDSAQRRTRNNSQSVAEKNHHEEKKSTAKPTPTQDFTLYNRLSPTDQNLVKRIGSMGFPLERVAAVLNRIGNDDKKIVEHLIPLCELLDLGFEEEKISDALVKFDNNKHKALDYLIS